MRRLNDAIYRALQFLLTALIAVLIVPVTLQVFGRFTSLIPHFIWTEEMARFCLVWIIMIGASVAVRDGAHFDVDVLPHPRTAAGAALGRMAVHVSIFLVALIFLAFGWRFTLFGYDQESELTGMNMALIHVAWPIAGLTWALFMIEKLRDDLHLFAQGGAPVDEPR